MVLVFQINSSVFTPLFSVETAQWFPMGTSGHTRAQTRQWLSYSACAWRTCSQSTSLGISCWIVKSTVDHTEEKTDDFILGFDENKLFSLILWKMMNETENCQRRKYIRTELKSRDHWAIHLITRFIETERGEVTPASQIGPGSSPSCSISNPAPC